MSATQTWPNLADVLCHPKHNFGSYSIFGDDRFLCHDRFFCVHNFKNTESWEDKANNT